jgi:hypothetical protein
LRKPKSETKYKTNKKNVIPIFLSFEKILAAKSESNDLQMDLQITYLCTSISTEDFCGI